MENLFGELLDFFNADYSNRLGNGLASFLVNAVDVVDFIEWHRIYSFGYDLLGNRLTDHRLLKPEMREMWMGKSAASKRTPLTS